MGQLNMDMENKSRQPGNRLEVKSPTVEFINGKRKAEIEKEMKNYKKLGSVIF
jgi:hypothetical protein